MTVNFREDFLSIFKVSTRIFHLIKTAVIIKRIATEIYHWRLGSDHLEKKIVGIVSVVTIHGIVIIFAAAIIHNIDFFL